ncbi:MAG: tRNA dihydrouridine synthase DusB [Planctomycetota bacterium]|jgi:nifR3 family TIM-barrel protein|nr:tRNA dihydrouridine synthase DusB [Planctomycetota bacterium]
MLQPLKIRSLELANNLIQAPLAGYSSMPFRLLTKRLGNPGLVVTEMISARAAQMRSPKQDRYLARVPAEGKVAFQLWGNDPAAFAEAAKIAVDAGADAIDVNCGCPVKKVRAAGAGSKLMEDPPLIGRIVERLRAATPLPVSVKIRVGLNEQNYNGVEVAKVAAAAGADFITAHGRHAAERYSHPARYEKIAEIVAAVAVPVIGNGDVRDGDTARKMFAVGCAGVMVGRACMGAPWVFAKIQAELRGEEWTAPTRAAMTAALLEHYDLLADLLGDERAIRQTRKLGALYSRGAFAAKEFRNRMNYLRSRADLVEALHLLEQ